MSVPPPLDLPQAGRQPFTFRSAQKQKLESRGIVKGFLQLTLLKQSSQRYRFLNSSCRDKPLTNVLQQRLQLLSVQINTDTNIDNRLLIVKRFLCEAFYGMI